MGTSTLSVVALLESRTFVYVWILDFLLEVDDQHHNVLSHKFVNVICGMSLNRSCVFNVSNAISVVRLFYLEHCYA